MKNSSINWKERQNNLVRRALNLLERANLALEGPVGRLVKDPRYNPFYHTGTISVFLLLVILVTGVYLSLFYPFGFDIAYQTVARVEANPIGRIMRALHRYASAAALITALLHGWRTLFMDRFRGPRWLAWVTGVVMVAAVWAAGITGYWMIWDERAQVITDSLLRLVQGWPAALSFLLDNVLTTRADKGWFFVLLTEIVHVALGLAIIFFFIYHIKRLSRAKINPPRYWAAGLLLILVLAAAFFPVGMLPAGPLPGGDVQRVPGQFPIDIFFLFYLPWALKSPGVFWGAVTLLFIGVGVFPWIIRRKPLEVIKIDAPRCTGCTLCAADCPYKALRMDARSDGLPHKFIAVLDPALCVSCGVCIGSCPTLAITLGDQPAEAIWEQVVTQAAAQGQKPISVVFTCERHVFQGAQGQIGADGQIHFPAAPAAEKLDSDIRIIPMTCIGMAHPDLVQRAMAAGAADVRFVGCPPEDCANREGNLWMQQRLERKRMPRLRLEKSGGASHSPAFQTIWTAPNDFWRGLRGKAASTPASAYEEETSFDRQRLLQFAPALLLMAGILAVQLVLTNVPFQPYPGEQSVVEITLEHESGGALALTAADPDDENTRLVILIDGKPAMEKSLSESSSNDGRVVGYARLPVAAGVHQVVAELTSSKTGTQQIMNEQIDLQAGQIGRLTFKDFRLSGDPEYGKKIFLEQVFGVRAGCSICHSLEPGDNKVGPSLAGVGERAAQRVPGLSAEAYLFQSIMEPNAYIVEGYSKGQMPLTFKTILNESQIQDVVAFLLTLK